MGASEHCCLGGGCARPEFCDELGKPCGVISTFEEIQATEQRLAKREFEMAKWAVTMELWPQHGFTEKDVGGRVHKFEVRGETVTKAAEVADLVGTMMQRGNPLSWNYSITEMKRLHS